VFEILEIIGKGCVFTFFSSLYWTCFCFEVRVFRPTPTSTAFTYFLVSVFYMW
jgi:hypothetical protein